MIQKRATSVAFFFLSIFSLGHINIGLAQEAVYRCGDVITNDAVQAKREKCKLLESGAVLTVPSHQKSMEVTKTPRKSNLSQSQPLKYGQVAPPPRSVEQQARDRDAKLIIESELKKTEMQAAELRKQYAAISATQDVDKKLALKQQIDRADADIASLKRELKR